MKKNPMCFMALLFIAIICCCFSFPVGAEYNENLPITEPADMQPATDDGVGLPSEVNLAEAVSETTGKPYFPALRKQYGGSCTAWACAYYQFSYEVARNFDLDVSAGENQGCPTNVFSPYYLWNYYNHGYDEGGVFDEDAYDFLMKNGCLRWSDYSPDPYCNSWYNADTDLQALYESLEYRISNYTQEIFAYDQTNAMTPIITSNNDTDLNKMKRLLSQGHTLMIGTPTDSPKIGSAGGYPVTFYSRRIPESENEKKSHAVLIVGYDDNLYCDANGNNICETQEKGAFLVADSFNNVGEVGRFYWIMYDALNNRSNYNYGYNQTYRVPGINYCKYWFIDVERYDPQLTVEITLTQKYRNDITVKLLRKTVSGTTKTEETFLKGYVADSTKNMYNIDFDGGTGEPKTGTRTFVFDYGAYDLYSGNNYYYGVYIEDITYNDATTGINQIVWKLDGEEIKRIQPSADNNPNGGHVSYYTPGKPVTAISLSKTAHEFYKYDTHTLTATVTPSNATNKDIFWSTSNSSCVAVTQSGVVTAVAPGTAIITANAKDGTGVSATCIYTVKEGNSWETAVSCSYGKNETTISKAGEDCWLKYTPAQSGNYIFYSESGFNVRGSLYNSGADEIAFNDNMSSSNKNFLFAAYLTAGQTYRLEISSPSNSTGEFAFYVVRKEPADKVAMANADARLMVFSASVPTFYDKAIIDINDYEVTVSFNNTYVESDDGIRAKLLTNYTPEISANAWNLFVDISAVEELIGTALTVDIEFFVDNVSVVTTNFSTNAVAYKTTLISGVEVSANNSMQLLLADIPSADGEELTVLDSNKQPITVTSTTKAKTGMIILRKDTANNKIKEVMFVIVIGDVQGDGYINSLDVSFVLRHDAETQELTGVYVIAGDVNIDGDTNSLDASLISRYDAKLIEISQDVIYTEVPDCIYYQYPVDFDLYN